jgi:hypothetical protein
VQQNRSWLSAVLTSVPKITAAASNQHIEHWAKITRAEYVLYIYIYIYSKQTKVQSSPGAVAGSLSDVQFRHVEEGV